MPSVSVSPENPNYTHDIALSSRGQMYGLNFVKGYDGLQRVPISGTAQLFDFEQEDWTGGRGRQFAKQDPTSYYDANQAWCLTPSKLFAVPQIRHAKGLRSEDTFFPGDGTASTEWKALYADGVARYITTPFVASATYSADYARMIIRRIGSPGTLTLELCPDSTGDPGAAAKTVTKAATDVEDGATVSLTHKLKFDWATTESLTATTTYHIKIYGAATDNINNHWEILVDTGTSGSKTSANNSTWAAGGFKAYYRVCDADTKRRAYPYYQEGAWYTVLSYDDKSTTSTIWINGDTGTAAGTSNSTSIVKTSAGWTADRYINAYCYIHEGACEGQVRLITDNTADTLTVSPAFNGTPGTTSKFTIIGTPWWKQITTSGTALGAIVGPPVVAQRLVWFPKGAGSVVLRMTAAYVVSEETGVYADAFRPMLQAANHTIMAVVYKTSKCYTYTIPDSMTGITLLSRLTQTKLIGGSDYWITGICVHDKKLHIFKENKVYTMSGGTAEEINIALDDMPSRRNGVASVSHQNYLYWTWAGSIERMIQGNAADVMNFKHNYEGMPADRKSTPVNLSNFLNWVVCVMDGGTAYKSSILVWNDSGWMEVFRGYEVGAQIREAWMQSHLELRPRLWWNMDGDMMYMDLPLNDNNPLQDSGMRYEHECSVITGAIDGNSPTLNKLINKLQVVTQNLTYGRIEVDYQTDNDVWSTTWKALPDAITNTPSQNVILNMGDIKRIAFRLRIYTTVPTTPAVVTSYRVEGWKAEPVRHQWIGRFEIGHGSQTKLGADDHDPDELEKWLREIAQEMREVTLHSRVAGDHLIPIVVSSPSINRRASAERRWQGTMTLMFREA